MYVFSQKIKLHKKTPLTLLVFFTIIVYGGVWFGMLLCVIPCLVDSSKCPFLMQDLFSLYGRMCVVCNVIYL